MREQRTISRKERSIGWGIGQSAVEVAIVAPVVLLVLLIVIDAGRLFFTYLQVSEAARAGAQYGAQSLQTSSNDTQMGTYATNAAPNIPGLTATGSHFCCCPSSDGTTCTNFGSTSTTLSAFKSSCGVDPLASTQPSSAPSTCASCPCPHWRKYDQVTATATFNSITRFPGIPSTLTFTTKTLLRAR